MKKLSIIFVFLLIISFTASKAQAKTLEQIRSEIASITTQIQALSQQAATITATQNAKYLPTSTTLPAITSSSTISTVNFNPTSTLVKGPLGYEFNDTVSRKAESANTLDTNKSMNIDTVHPTKELKLAVVLINYQDHTNPSETFTKADVEKIVAPNGSFNKFEIEQSYGNISFNSDVYGWYTLPENTPEVCPLDRTPTENMKSIVRKNLTKNKYDFVYLFVYCAGKYPGVNVARVDVGYDRTDGVDSYGHLSVIGKGNYFLDKAGNDFPFKWTLMDAILAHEIGHSLGEGHAGTLDCGESWPKLGSRCANIEYGNYFDIMGTGMYGLHFNAMEKEELGWIPKNDIVNIDKSGTYSLKPLELSGAQVGIIPFDEYQKFAIEYRKPVGFDPKLKEGLYVYIADNSRHYDLVNMHPSKKISNNNIEEAGLLAGQSYTNTEFTIGNIKNGKTPISPVTFDIKLNEKCNTKIPPITDELKSTGGNMNMISYKFNFKNGYTCKQNKLNVNLYIPQTFFGKESTSPFKMGAYEIYNSVPKPNKENNIENPFEIRKDLKDGKYPITAIFKDTKTNESVTKTTYFTKGNIIDRKDTKSKSN